MKSGKLIVGFLILLIVLGVFLRVVSLNKDITGEETDFVKSAKAIKETGKPVYYHSEQQKNETALWHPPMYIYLLSLFSKNEMTMRSVNVIFSLLTALLIFLFCLKFFDKNIGLISSALFLLNYYILSSSLIIDIDMLSAFFIFAFVFCVLMAEKNKKYYLLASFALFFALFNRWPIAILVYLGVFAYLVWTNGFRFWKKEETKYYFFMGIVSALLFVAVWGIYAFYMKASFFSFLIHNFKLGGEQISSIFIYFGSFILNIAQLTRLLTLPFLILMLYAFFYFARNKNKKIWLLGLSSLIIFVFFALLPRPAFGYPRYFLSMMPFACILISVLIYENLKNIHLSRKMVIIAILGFLISLDLLFFSNAQVTTYTGNGLIKATNLPDFLFNILASLPLLFVFAFKEKERKQVIIVILLMLVLSYSLYFDIKTASYKSMNKEVGNYLKNNTNESDIVVATKAVGYYSERRFYFNDNNKPLINFSMSYISEYIKKSYENRNMNDEFFWRNEYFSAINGGIPDNETLKKVKYVVLYHEIEGKKEEKKIGGSYVYGNG